MQAAMGTRATSISKSTVHHWLKGMDWRYGRAPNGMYIDHQQKGIKLCKLQSTPEHIRVPKV